MRTVMVKQLLACHCDRGGAVCKAGARMAYCSMSVDYFKVSTYLSHFTENCNIRRSEFQIIMYVMFM